MFVIFGSVNDVDGVICFTSEEHNAVRLVEALAASDLTWERIGYNHISVYRDTHKKWEYPFYVKLIQDYGHIVKPSWIDFDLLDSSTILSNTRSKSYETSRTSEGRVLPPASEDDFADSIDDLKQESRDDIEDVRSRMRRRSRINRDRKGL